MKEHVRWQKFDSRVLCYSKLACVFQVHCSCPCRCGGWTSATQLNALKERWYKYHKVKWEGESQDEENDTIDPEKYISLRVPLLNREGGEKRQRADNNSQ